MPKKVSEFDLAAALTGAELIGLVQAGGNVQSTLADVVALVAVGDGLTGPATAFADTMWMRPTINTGTDITFVGMTTNSLAYNTKPAPTTTTLSHSMIGCQHECGSGAGSIAGYACGNPGFLRGNTAGMGGFIFRQKFSPYNNGSGSGGRLAVGLKASTAQHGDFDPSTMVNCIMVAADKADANLSVMHNDATGTCTKIALGAGFPKVAVSAYPIEVTFSCTPNGAAIDYIIRRVDTDETVTGTIASNLPASDAFMGPHAFVCNNAGGTGGASDRATIWNHGFICVTTE